MALPVSVPYAFANATTTQNLSYLDSNFNTLAYTLNGIGNGTVSLANVNITGGSISANLLSSSISSGTSNVSITSSNGPVSISTNGTNAFYVDTNQNVGIGTTSPSYKLQVNDSVGTTLRPTASGIATATVDWHVTNGSGNAYFGCDNSTGTVTGTAYSAYIYNGANSPMVFYVNAQEKIRIGTSGQFGIGGANYGTSGQVLTSNGASAAPSWQNSGSGVGVGQTWTDVTSSRVSGTTYTNSTGKPIMVVVSGGSASLSYTINGISGFTSSSTSYMQCSFIVPDGNTYSVTNSNFVKWAELR